MARLVAHGCSFTYGHGLPDCFIPPRGFGPKPSQIGWVNQLATKLNLTPYNLGVPGSGNKEILARIISAEYDKDDTVIIGWSQFHRYSFYRHIDDKSGYRISDKEIDAILAVDVNDPKYMKNNRIDNWMCIYFTNLFLNSINIKNYHFLAIHENSRPKPFYNVTNFLDVQEGEWCADKALDNAHPGMESNRLLANLLYDKIKEHELR